MATMANIATKQKPNEVSKIVTLNILANEANRDKKQVPKLREFLQENPDIVGNLQSVSVTIRESLVEKFIAGDGSRLLVKKYMDELEDRLRGDEPTQIEKLLIEAVLFCWLRLQHAENHRGFFMDGKEHRFVDMEFADKMLSKAHSRYLRALTTLAKVQDMNARKKKKDIKLKKLGSEWQ
jgi:hypothetical protein